MFPIRVCGIPNDSVRSCEAQRLTPLLLATPAGEVVALKVPDIDRERKVLYVEQGKGRNAMCPKPSV